MVLALPKCTEVLDEAVVPPVSLKSISGGHTFPAGQSNSASLGPGLDMRERTKYAPYVWATPHWHSPPVTHRLCHAGSRYVLSSNTPSFTTTCEIPK